MTDVLSGPVAINPEVQALQDEFEMAMNPRFAQSTEQLMATLKEQDAEIERAQRQARTAEQQREQPLREYEKRLADFAATLPGKDPFYAASYFMDGRFDGTWEAHARNSGNMIEYWHKRGMLLAGLNAFLTAEVQPVFLLDIATAEMGGERGHPFRYGSAPVGHLENKFMAVIGHSSAEMPLSIAYDEQLDTMTGATTRRPSKVLLNVEIDKLIVSDRWPDNDWMQRRGTKAGVRTIGEGGLLHVPILEAPFPSIGNAANQSLSTVLGNTNIFGTTNVLVGSERIAREFEHAQSTYVNGVPHDIGTWTAISEALTTGAIE